MNRPIKIFLLFLPTLLSGCARSMDPVITLPSGNISVVLAAEGGRLKSGGNTVELQFKSEPPQLIERPSLLLYMPAMGTMPEMRSSADLSPSDSPGVFNGKLNLEMSGTWQGLIEFMAGTERRQEIFSIRVE